MTLEIEPKDRATQTTLAALLAQVDVALSTRALEAGGNLAAIKTAAEIIDGFADPLNVLWGYNDRLLDSQVDLNAAAGTIGKFSAIVPANEVWVVEFVGARNATRAARIILEGSDAANLVRLVDQTGTVADEVISWTGRLTLKEGDRILFSFVGTVLNDDLYWQVWGYKMKV